jgi:sulfur-oxidizing protein SoxB
VQQGGDMVRAGGFDFVCSPGAAMGSRISDMTRPDGTKIDAGKTYKVAGWASVNLPQDGKPVWDVVARYLRGMKQVKLGRPSQVKLAGVDGNQGYGT